VAHLDEDLVMFLSDFSDARPPSAAGGTAPAGSTRLPLAARGRALGRRASGRARELAAATAAQVKKLGSRVASTWRGLSRRTKTAMAAGSATVVVVAVIVAIVASSNDTEERLLRAVALIDQAKLGQAEGMLDALERDGIEVELLAGHRERIAEVRARQAAERIETLVADFDAKRYDAVLASVSDTGDAYKTDARVCFAIAESYRLSGQPASADTYWRWFIERWPENVRIDDAMFWRAEHLAVSGEPEEAAALFERIVRTPKSNFKRSARKRLRALRRKKRP
jgi:TolA-binding protein